MFDGHRSLAMRLILLLTIVVYAAHAAKRFDRDQVWRIIPERMADLNKLITDQTMDALDVWRAPSSLGRAVDVHVPTRLINNVKKMLNSTGMQYSVMIDDLQKLIDNETVNTNGSFDFNKYNTFESIIAQLQDFTDNYPNLTSLINIGVSHENRAIYAIKVGRGGSSKPAIFLEGTIHAREWVVAATLLYNIKFLLEGYGLDSQITSLLDQVNFYVLPVANPDGYVYSWTTNRMWRKTRTGPHGIFRRCYGVDPNRNWDDNFGGSGTSNFPCRDTYRGPSAFSEAETLAVSKWVLKNKNNIKAYLGVHAYSQMWMTPYGWTKNQYPPHYEEQYTLAERVVLAIESVNGLKFKHGTIAEVIYLASGSSIDWAYSVAGIKYSYAIELRDEGQHGFLLPAEQIQDSGEEFFQGLLVVAEQVAKEAHAQGSASLKFASYCLVLLCALLARI